MTDIEELKSRLCTLAGPEPSKNPMTDGMWETKAVHRSVLLEAADAIEQLQRELEREKIERQTFQHGHRIASDNCIRLERELEEARKDAALLRECLSDVLVAEVCQEDEVDQVISEMMQERIDAARQQTG